MHIQLPVHINDPLSLLFPEIGEIKDRLYEQGAVYASMSGSGSSVFALFDKEVDLADCYPGCFVWTGICEV